MPRLSSGPTRGPPVTLDFEGQSVPAFDGEPVACSLLAAGHPVFSRSTKYHRPRGPFCFAAACSHCLMRVDGVPNLYTCQVPAKNGMRVQRQNAYPSAENDVFRAIDWMFPHGMDHHQMFAGVPIAEKVMAKVARHLSGLGLLPDLPAPPRPAPEAVRTRVVIVGGGAAGLAAASELARESIPFLLCEAEGFLGGRLAVAPMEADAPPMPPALPSSDAVRLRARAIAIYDHREGPGVLAIEGLAAGPRLLKVVADRYLIAVGGHPALIPFENNDLPGVFAGRAVSYLIRRWGLIPGHLFALVGRGREIHPLAQLIEASGGRVAAIVPTSGAAKILKAHGRTQVRGLSFETADGPQRVACDAVVVAEDPSPSFALAEQAGAAVSFQEDLGTFIVEANAEGRTAASQIFVAGDITGPKSAAEAAECGIRAAKAIARELR